MRRNFNVFTLSAIALLALTAAGCNNALDEPMPGQTPTSENPKSPSYGAAGGPLVPANNPNGQLKPTPPGGTGGGYYGNAGAPLVAPNSPDTGPNAGSTTQSEQRKSGYFPSAGAPLSPPTTTGPTQ